MTEHAHRQPWFQNGDERRRPEIRRVTVTEVRFNRGEGCCTDDPTRMVTAYYDDDGNLLAEHDPHPTKVGDDSKDEPDRTVGEPAVLLVDGAPIRYRCDGIIDPDGADCGCVMFRLSTIIVSQDGGDGNLCVCGHRYDDHTAPPATAGTRPITGHAFQPVGEQGSLAHMCAVPIGDQMMCGQPAESHLSTGDY